MFGDRILSTRQGTGKEENQAGYVQHRPDFPDQFNCCGGFQ